MRNSNFTKDVTDRQGHPGYPENPPSFDREREGRIDSDVDIHRTLGGGREQHLILRHNHSGSLYYSKVPDKLNTDSLLEDSDLDLQLEMPRGSPAQPCFLRWFLTLLHAATSMVSGFCFIFSLFGTIFSDQCLPCLVNKDGSHVESQFGFTALCDGALFGLGFVFVVNIIMCGLVQCSLNKIPMVVVSLFLTTCVSACAVVGGSMFTVHYALWCDSISQNLLLRHVRCADAAANYDRLHRDSNMAALQSQMELQQIAAWSLFPLTFITPLCYALAMRVGGRPGAAGEDDLRPPGGFYQYLATRAASDRDASAPYTGDTDERSPFLRRDN